MEPRLTCLLAILFIGETAAVAHNTGLGVLIEARRYNTRVEVPRFDSGESSILSQDPLTSYISSHTTFIPSSCTSTISLIEEDRYGPANQNRFRVESDRVTFGAHRHQSISLNKSASSPSHQSTSSCRSPCQVLANSVYSTTVSYEPVQRTWPA